MRRCDRRASCRRCAGWTLIHMAVAISLLGMFMLGAARVFMMTQGTVRKSQQGLTAIHQSQSMVGYLRADVWSATQMTTPAAQADGQADEQSLEIRKADESVITWKFSDASFARHVKRAGADAVNPFDDADPENAGEAVPVRQWPIDVAKATFAIEGPVLVLKLFTEDDEPEGELRLTSQVILTHAMHDNTGQEAGKSESGKPESGRQASGGAP